MNFKESVLAYLIEGRSKIDPNKLKNPKEIEDVFPGYKRIVNKRFWGTLTFSEFHGFMSMWIQDYYKRYGSRKGAYANKEQLGREANQNYTTNEYKKAYQVLKDYLAGDINDNDLDRNPGNVAYDIVRRFFVAAADLRKGWSSKTHHEAFKNQMS
jgi:hypothetical protein